MSAAGSLSRAVSAEAGLGTLHGLLDWLDAACAEAGLGEDVAFALRLAVEEVCANVIRHGYGDAAGPIRLAFSADERLATVTVEDEGPPFDPADAPAPDLDAGWEERRVGGLGWHLAYQLTDRLCHEPLAPRGNRIVLCKRRDGA